MPAIWQSRIRAYLEAALVHFREGRGGRVVRDGWWTAYLNRETPRENPKGERGWKRFHVLNPASTHPKPQEPTCLSGGLLP